MKKLITLTIAATFLLPILASAEQEVTPLQLKVMQTRLFTKPIKEVAKAAQEDGESLGALTCVQNKNTQQKPEDGVSGTVTCVFKPQISLFGGSSSDYFRVVYEMSSPPKDNETTMRIKIFVNWKEPRQLNDPEAYAKRFKNIGDLIFIEAIPLNLTVQN